MATSIFPMVHHASSSALFPYTTLFRSEVSGAVSAPRHWRQRARAVGQGRRGERHPRQSDRRQKDRAEDRKSTCLNSSHPSSSYGVFCLKKSTSVRRHMLLTCC